MTLRTVDLHVPELTRVEGGGALHVTVRNGVVDDVQLEIFEAPRLFEALLRGRGFAEPIDITARICGICPVAYQLTACQAIESIDDVRPEPGIRELRRLLYCGEWIASHVLHMAFLHAPDFVGVDSAFDLAHLEPDLLDDVLHLKRTGNRILDVVGGRPIHPVNVRAGGFHRIPSQDEVVALADDLERAHDAAIALVRWVAGFDFPSLGARGSHTELVSLRDEQGYPIDGGRIVSDRGLDLDVADFGDVVRERHEPHSTALFARLAADGRERVYQTGPLARWANNADLVPDSVRGLADELGVAPSETNPFRSIIVRGLEVVWAIEEAQRIVATHRSPSAPYADVRPPVGVGHGATEAPRGLLFHRYEIDRSGRIAEASIIPPTSQNQEAIRRDLATFVSSHLDLDDQTLARRCELVIRNFDPCISCASHFLRVDVERADDDLSAPPDQRASRRSGARRSRSARGGSGRPTGSSPG